MQCVGPSMLPTFNNRGDVVIFERVHITVFTPLCSELKFMSESQISARNGYIARGDVVVSRSPTNPVQLVCKRVVALVRLTSLHSLTGLSDRVDLNAGR